MIRGSFHVEPYSLTDDDFAKLASEAIWLHHFEVKKMKSAVLQALAVAFGKGED